MNQPVKSLVNANSREDSISSSSIEELWFGPQRTGYELRVNGIYIKLGCTLDGFILCSRNTLEIKINKLVELE